MGGIADSDYLGAEGSVAEMVGFDIHSVAGLLRVNQKLTKSSGTTVDDFVKAAVSCSDGNSYHFGSTNGKIWKKTSAGTWSLEATASPAAGSAGVTGAAEYQGYIYYAMQNRLGRWQIGTDWSTRSDNFATFDNGDADFHPMKEVNLVLYIGDGKYVAQVDAGSFASNALDIAAPLRIKTLGKWSTDLLIGTFINNNVTETELLRWNTWSPSFSASDSIPEVGINAFLPMDNFTLVNAGTKGNLYLYNGAALEPYKTIKGEWSATQRAVVHPNATLNFHGLPLFGVSLQTGAPLNFGIYSLGRTNRNYPFVLNHEYVISTGNKTLVEIGSIIGTGDTFLVSWRDTNSGTVYGVDELDLTAKYSGAYFITRVIAVAREKLSNYKLVDVAYRLLPDSTAIAVQGKVNHGTFEDFESAKDTMRNTQAGSVDLSEATTVQVKVATTASGNNAPEIESVLVGVE